MKAQKRSVLAIRVHPEDNVAVVAADVQAGSAVRLDDGTEVRTVEAIARGSKVALIPIPCGEAVIRYGEEIGQATCDIAAGQHVHTHNLRRGG
jgi:altronate hydrolase